MWRRKTIFIIYFRTVRYLLNELFISCKYCCNELMCCNKHKYLYKNRLAYRWYFQHNHDNSLMKSYERRKNNAHQISLSFTLVDRRTAIDCLTVFTLFTTFFPYFSSLSAQTRQKFINRSKEKLLSLLYIKCYSGVDVR